MAPVSGAVTMMLAVRSLATRLAAGGIPGDGVARGLAAMLVVVGGSAGLVLVLATRLAAGAIPGDGVARGLAALLVAVGRSAGLVLVLAAL